MNKPKLILSSLLALSLSLTLASCGDKEVRNQNHPYGSINSDALISYDLNNTSYNITNQELYDGLKYTVGYTAFTNWLEKTIYKDELANVLKNYKDKDAETKETIDEAFASACYGTAAVDTLRFMTNDELTEKQNAFIDTMKNSGITVTTANLTFDTITKDSKTVSFSNLTDELITYYGKDLAKKLAGKAYIESICDVEYLDENNKPVSDASEERHKNAYYIDEETLETRYENYNANYYTAHGIVLTYNSLKEATAALNKAKSEVTTPVDDSNYLLDLYINLYNNAYSYKGENLTRETITENENTTFVSDKDGSDLADINSSLEAEFISETRPDNTGLQTPRSINGKYVLMYRYDLVYNASKSSKKLSYNELKDNMTAEELTAYKATLKADFIDYSASSVSSNVYQTRLEDKNIEIWDPFIENQFAGNYTFYEYVETDASGEYLITSTDEALNLKVDDFYTLLKTYNVNSTVMDLILNDYFNNQTIIDTYLTEDELEELETSLEDDKKAFEKGEANLNKAYGLENYYFYQYGYYNYDDVKASQIADSIVESYFKDYLYDNMATEDHQIGNVSFLVNILDKALALYAETKHYTVNVDHILISVDNDKDGSPDDMRIFLESLSEEEKAKFEEAVLNLSKAIADEVTAIQNETTMDKLTYIVEAFNRGLNNHSGVSWDTYKTYNFTLTAESLGDVTEDSITSYVAEFQDYIKAIYEKCIETELEIPEDEEDQGQLFFPETDVDASNFTLKDLCYTQYGYHMLSLNSYSDDSESLDFDYTESNDSAGDYKDLTITIDEKDAEEEDDDIYVITNAYNTLAESERDNKPSINQVFIYYVEKTNGSVTDLPSYIQNDLSDLLDDVISQYQNEDFQKFLLYSLIIKPAIKTNNLAEFNMDNYLKYLQNQASSYKTDYQYNDWYDGSVTWVWER